MEDKFSICIVSWDNLFDLDRLLQSIDAHTQVPHEVCIVDNGSEEEVQNYLRQYQLDHTNKGDKIVKIHFNQKNEGIGIGRNQAMKFAEGNYIVICDSDIVVPRNWIQDMLEVYKRDPDDIGAVGTSITGGRQKRGKDYWETDFITSCCMLIPKTTIDRIKIRFLQERDTLLKRVEKEEKEKSYNYVEYEEHLKKIKWYIEKETGYWDPAFPYGVDDFDYSLLIRWAGLRLAVAELVPITHKHASHRPTLAEHRDKCVREGFQYYCSKWSIMEDFYEKDEQGSVKWDPQMWNCLKMNKEYQEGWKALMGGNR